MPYTDNIAQGLTTQLNVLLVSDETHKRVVISILSTFNKRFGKTFNPKNASSRIICWVIFNVISKWSIS